MYLRVQLIEKRRTDFIQMMVHHAFTILLITFSYFQHFHVSGTAVLITLDVADIFLPLAKVRQSAAHTATTAAIASFTTAPSNDD
jgi:hypothetical protein